MKQAAIECVFWGVFTVLVIALFLLNKNTIAEVFARTQIKKFFSKAAVEKSVEQFPEIQITQEVMIAASSGDGSTEPDNSGSGSTSLQEVRASVAEEPTAAEVSLPLSAEKTHDSPDTGTAATVTASGSSGEVPAAPQTANASEPDTVDLRKITIYWVITDEDGKIIRRAENRMMPKSASPMTDALTELLAGPSPAEVKRGMLSLIPEGTVLRSASVKEGIAFIDMSDEFQFNRYGIDGYFAQLAQIVFTATEFSTVNSVQFLIEGRKKEYLGAEGVWIGSPLSRKSF